VDGNYKESLKLVLAHEGGFVDHPKDPGGPTNKGVTQRVYDTYRQRKGQVTRSVRLITAAEAEAIYRQQYWDLVDGDGMPDGLDYAMFDYAVNSGPGRAIKDLQRVLKVGVDGVIGQETLAAACAANAEQTIIALCTKRLAFMKSLKTWATFGKGWSRRVMGAQTGYQERDTGVIDYAVNFNRKSTGSPLAKSLPKPVAIGSLPGEEAPAKADPTEQSVSKTKVGGAGIAAGAGGGATMLLQAKELVEPHTGGEDMFSKIATLVFVLLTMIAIGFAIYAYKQRIDERAGA
jgi:lysozyme family protein